MRGFISQLSEVASGQWFLVSREQAMSAGVSQKYIEYQIESGRWLRVHDGVYQIDTRPRDWEEELMAAALACGPEAVVSHRAAFVLWRLDGISSRAIELTVPFNNHPMPDGVLVHRSRRRPEATKVRGIPVTTVERTLLDCAAFLPRIVIAKALDSALRRGLTSMERMWFMLVNEGGRGVRGTKSLRWVLRERALEATDSGSEFELLCYMQQAMLPSPELKREFFYNGRRIVPDFYWAALNKAVEVDGIDSHSSADKLTDDLERQNALLDLGIELRRFSARLIRRDPKRVIAEIRQFLEA